MSLPMKPGEYFLESAPIGANLGRKTIPLVVRHTDFGSLQAYLDGYSVAGDALAGLQVPATILTARDDPVIPVGAFERLQLPPTVELDIAPYGGHCGFIGASGTGSFTDNYIAARFNAVAQARTTATAG